jgi:hypothetical protein
MIVGLMHKGLMSTIFNFFFISSNYKPVGQHPITTASTGSESAFLSDVLLFEKISAKSKNIFALEKKL